MDVGREVANQIAGGDGRIFGVMIESHLKAGREDLLPGRELVYGQSLTDACLGREDSRKVLDVLAGRRAETALEGSGGGGGGIEAD